MIREQKNKFWLTLILILSLSFSAFALGIANVFAPAKNGVVSVDAAETPTYYEGKVADTGWKKIDKASVTTTVSTIGTIYGGTTIQVQSADELNSANDETWHSTLKVKVSGTDNLGNTYDDTYQPYIQNGYRLKGFYFYVDATKYTHSTYGDLFEAGESVTTEQIDPTYTGKITIKAVCELIQYKAYMYYSIDGKTWKEQVETFTVKEDFTKLTPRPEKLQGNVQEFSCWAIKGIDHGNIEFGFKPESDEMTNPKLIEGTEDLYKITHVRGFSSEINNFKIDKFEEVEGNFTKYDPTIRATWSYVYNGLIDNKASNTIDDTKVAAFSVDGNCNSKQANLKFSANPTNYDFGFFRNDGYAFETAADNLKDDTFGATGKYGVYNYGHEVTGWNIYFSHGGNDAYSPIYNGTEWSGYNTVKTSMDIDELTSARMYSLADKLDALFIKGYDNRTITFEPVWQAVDIKVVAEYVEGGEIKTKDILTITYALTYTIADGGVFAPTGKSIYYYTTTSGNIIAKKHLTGGINYYWNYVKIPQNDFDADSYDASTKTYTLNVAPTYVDNIYRINLNGDVDHSSILYHTVNGSNYTYKLKQEEIEGAVTNNQYKFAVASGETENEYKITSSILGLSYNDCASSSTVSIENYINNTVVPVKTTYESQIADGSLSILRKVFTGNSGATLSESDLNCTTGLSNEQFYIYLANNRKSGSLPVFLREYYDLIAWDNNHAKDSYITTAYDETMHSEDFEGYDILNINDNTLPNRYWTRADFEDALELNAHYFRKTYLLDLNVLREGTTNEGRYGYIYLNIEDKTVSAAADNKSAKIIAVYQGEAMQYFDVRTGYSNINSISGKTALTETSSLLRVKEVGKEKVLCVLLFAGCDVTIKASCVDWFGGENCNDLTYRDMVGYYLSSINTTNDATGKGSLFTDVTYSAIADKTAGVHSITKTAAQIESKDYPTNTKIEINASFAPIDYTITVTLKSLSSTGLVENPFAGRVDCYDTNTTTEDKTITFTGNVETWSQLIEYLANAGYTLCADAVTTEDKDGVKHILLSYDLTQGVGDVINSDVDMRDGREDKINKQEYAFNLDGKWLIENYYTDEYDARTGGVQTLAIDVNTELLTFDYKIEIIDNDGNVLSTYNNGTVILDGSTSAENITLIGVNNRKNSLDLGDLNSSVEGYQYNKITRSLVANEFEKINATEDFYVVKILKCTGTHEHTEICYKNYVVLESSLSQIVGGNNYKKIYNFLLKQTDLLDAGTDDDILTQAIMNSIFGTGNVVNPDNRYLTMQIKVAELYTITLKAQAHESKSDPGLIAGDRTTTIKNHVGGSGELTNSGTLTTSGADFTNSKVVYTYKGVRNHLSSTFNSKMYEGVEYKLGDSSSNIEKTGEEYIFTLDPTKVDENGNRDLIVTYIPKPITAFNVEYVLNGQDKSYSEVSSIIEEIKKPTSVELYYNGYTEYLYKMLSQDYIVTTTLNGTVVDTNPILCIANESAFNAEGFFIIVNLQEVDKQAAQFRFLLADTEKAFADDYFGEFEVLVGGNVVELTAGNYGWYSVNIPEGRTVDLDLTKMGNGYKFIKLNRDASTLTSDINEDNIVNVTNSFSFGNSNIYSIIIDKEIIRATLTVTGLYKGKYSMSTTGIATNVVSDGVSTINAYLGKTLTFTMVDEDREKLDYYYYTDSTGAEHKIEPAADGTIQLRITSDLLATLGDKVDGVYNLNIGIKTINKYNLKYTVYNSVYAENIGVTLEDATKYVSGTNMLSGTKLLLNVIVKDNKLDADEITILEAKYNIKLSGCKIEDAEGNVITNGEEVNITTGKVDGVIVLDADKQLTISISPKSYKDASSNSESIYNSIEEYNSLNPTAATEPIGNFVMPIDNMYYGNVVTAKFNRVNPDLVKGGELAVIRLTGNDANHLIIYINGKQIVSIYDETANVEYVVDASNVKHSTVTDVTTTNVVNLSEVLQGYGYNLSFVSTTDKVEITFEVKNAIEISTEYLCYKTIKPII